MDGGEEESKDMNVIVSSLSTICQGKEEKKEPTSSSHQEEIESDEDGLQEEDEDEEEEADSDTELSIQIDEGMVCIKPSLFKSIPPTVYFPYPKHLQLRREDPFVIKRLSASSFLNFKTAWNRGSVKNAFLRAGFTQVKGKHWNAKWGKHLNKADFAKLHRFQKVNHFPDSWCIGRKDRLMKTLIKQRRFAGGNLYDFFPKGFNLPREHEALIRYARENPSTLWIVKPAASACGRGIKVLSGNNLDKVGRKKKLIVQQYVHNPMLINRRKFDIRLYVLVTSFDPLRAYCFEEGLVRFSTEPYSLKNLSCKFAHLTNYSINKKSDKFVKNREEEAEDGGEGASKWSLFALWAYLTERIGPERVQRLQTAIDEVVIKTLIAAEDTITPTIHERMKSTSSCYELFGFDILIDDQLKPWIVEVNISPSLAGSSPLDVRIKGKLMADVFHLVGFVPLNNAMLRRDEKVQKRMKARAGAVLNEADRKLFQKYKHLKPPNKSKRIQDDWRRDRRNPFVIDYRQLSNDDWVTLLQSESEFKRAGHFRLLFPQPQTVLDYLALFKTPKFNNCILARWILDGMSDRQHSILPSLFARKEEEEERKEQEEEKKERPTIPPLPSLPQPQGSSQLTETNEPEIKERPLVRLPRRRRNNKKEASQQNLPSTHKRSLSTHTRRRPDNPKTKPLRSSSQRTGNHRQALPKVTKP